MKLFKSKAEKELENIIGDIKINLSNNYKEPAHKARMKLKDRAENLYKAGEISENTYKKYIKIYEEYTVMMKDYHH